MDGTKPIPAPAVVTMVSCWRRGAEHEGEYIAIPLHGLGGWVVAAPPAAGSGMALVTAGEFETQFSTDAGEVRSVQMADGFVHFPSVPEGWGYVHAVFPADPGVSPKVEGIPTMNIMDGAGLAVLLDEAFRGRIRASLARSEQRRQVTEPQHEGPGDDDLLQ